MLDVFRLDPDFAKNEEMWSKIRKEIVGDDDDDSDSSSSGSGSGSGSDSDDSRYAGWGSGPVAWQASRGRLCTVLALVCGRLGVYVPASPLPPPRPPLVTTRVVAVVAAGARPWRIRPRLTLLPCAEPST
jgi:hypothetical protein